MPGREKLLVSMGCRGLIEGREIWEGGRWKVLESPWTSNETNVMEGQRQGLPQSQTVQQWLLFRRQTQFAKGFGFNGTWGERLPCNQHLGFSLDRSKAGC